MTLTQVRAIEDTPELVKGIVAYSTRMKDKVCGVCALGVWGHGPESRYLGYDKHEFTPVAATPEMIEHAHTLTGVAYRNRCKMELCGAYCVSTHKPEPCGHAFASPTCGDECKHTNGHCKACKYAPHAL